MLDCNITTKGYHGAIEMNSLESMRMAKCAWTIVAPKGNRVNMTFTSLNLVKSRLRSVNNVNGLNKFQFAVDSNCNNTQLVVSAYIFHKTKNRLVLCADCYKCYTLIL